MAFRLVTSAHGRFGKNVPKDATTDILKGQVLGWGAASGEVEPLDASSTFAEALFVSVEAITAAEALTSVQTFKINANDQYIADTVNNSNSAHNGQEMILNATGDLVNNTGTTSAVGVVRQVGVVGAAADKQIMIEFVSKQ
jgi:glucose/arabinose dehydrogenase